MGPILIFVGALLLGLVITATVFVVGMRAKTPWVLNAMRRFARGVANPYEMRSAGTSGAMASVIRHRGRTSGKAYETPVAAVATEDGFAIAMVYGSRTDWLQNVLASGSATIVNEGQTYRVDHPEVVPIEAAASYFPVKAQRPFRRYRVDRCFRVRRIGPSSGRGHRASMTHVS